MRKPLIALLTSTSLIVALNACDSASKVLHVSTEQYRTEQASSAERAVSYTHLTLPTTPYV